MTLPHSHWAPKWLIMLGAAVLIASVAGEALAQTRIASAFGKIDDEDFERAYQTEQFGRGIEGPGGYLPSFDVDRNRVDITKLQTELTKFSRTSSDLYDELDRGIRVVPEIRPHIGDMLKVRARSRLLAQRVDGFGGLEEYKSDIQGLDRDWRQLSYDLRAIRGMSRTAVRYIDELDAANDAIGQSLQISPTLDYRELVITTAELRASMSNLLDDIEIELGRTAEARRLQLQASQTQQQASHLAGLALEQASSDQLISEFKRFERDWTELNNGLRSYNNRYVERSARRVMESSQETRQLLLIPQEIDRAELVYLTRNLERDTNDFFDRAPLRILMRLPESEQALATADQFYGVLENYIDLVERNEEVDDLVEAYSYIDDAWTSFERVFRPINSEDAQQVLNSVEVSILDLQQSMLIEQSFDRHTAMELAAELENLAGHLDQDVRRWLSRSNPSYRHEALRDVSSFVTGSQSLHESLVTEGSIQEARRQASQVWDDWRRVYQHITKCDTSERPYLARTSSRTTPTLVDLRALLQ
ncbi:hypothetical protein [Calycomorphotria hydatis]|uniref:Uncharacterized protein n=1 Tax=Calycomorphotria hydatis TaxID=2528027 RepID=A0A517T3U9_9PLAN|nr:hypothetical protein [Calycomorphotria hydatis]QDT63046.1 hypothetical protein V22_02450 [Calycomorphotria hydatis]